MTWQVLEADCVAQMKLMDDYVEIARARIDYWAKQPKQLDLLGDAA